MTPAERLRDLLAQPGLHVMPGCFDALSARLIATSPSGCWMRFACPKSRALRCTGGGSTEEGMLHL